jgi:hypothetical protein
VLHQLQVLLQDCKQPSTPPDCYDEQTFQHTVLLVFLAVEVSQAVESDATYLTFSRNTAAIVYKHL